ncbi:MAG: hypothetical protein LBI49_24685 [Nocardiopsaceae bacterium]|jgi:hypothetical protein|nr:hypothetical protein [Nocardiopsaceae bacterium]
MLNAVWVAVIVGVAAWLALVCVGVFVLLRLARLATDASQAVTGLRERGDLLAERAHAAIDRADEQLTRTSSITASMDEVTSAMAELSRRLSVLMPVARAITTGAGAPLVRVSALAFGVNRALGLRRAGPARGQGHGDARALPRRGPASRGELTARRGPGARKAGARR